MRMFVSVLVFFFFQAEDGIRDGRVTGVQTCALPILRPQRAWYFSCLMLSIIAKSAQAFGMRTGYASKNQRFYVSTKRLRLTAADHLRVIFNATLRPPSASLKSEKHL